MRPEERIDNFLKIIGNYWKKSPDLRFTQFLFNHGIDNTYIQYHLEEENVLQLMFPDLNPREYLFWTTFGKNGDEERKVILIKNLETDHIKNILSTQKQISEFYRNILQQELDIRG